MIYELFFHTIVEGTFIAMEEDDAVALRVKCKSILVVRPVDSDLESPMIYGSVGFVRIDWNF